MVRLFQIAAAVVVGLTLHHYLTGLLDTINHALEILP